MSLPTGGIANPFFGQSLVVMSPDRKIARVNFPNWGLMTEEEFRTILNRRLSQKRITHNPVKTRREATGDFKHPTIWILEAV